MLAPFGVRPKGTTVARIIPLARRLATRGWEVLVLAPPFDCPDDSGRTDWSGGAEIRHLTWGRLNVVRWTGAMVLTALSFKPDVIHLFKPKGCGGLALPVIRHLGRNQGLVVDMDDREGRGGWNDVMRYPWYAKQLFQYQETSLPMQANAVTVASRALETLAWAQGVPPERVFYLPNGVDSGASAAVVPLADRSSRRFLLYSRFHEFDFDALVERLEPVMRESGVALDLAGSLSHGALEKCRVLIDQGLIRPHGWVDREQLERLASRAIAAIIPCEDSLINRCRCSAKLFELMGLGLPLVAHSVGEAASVIRDGVNGLLAPPGDYAALADCVRMLATDHRMSARLAANMQHASTEHSWDQRVDECIRAYGKAQAEVC